ncbi:MAG: glutathione S-transferase family protein [Roseibium sp.]|nr:glutathione S-transferase family protein [Roseibium sp.]
MGKLVFYTNPMSRGRVVRWMLEEVGVPYQTRVLAYGPEMKSAGYRKINPLGKVPALSHDGEVVTECAAICAYLADAFPDAGLAPPLAERAAYYRWLFFTSGPMEACLINRALGFQVPDDKRASAGYGTYEDMLDTAELAVKDREFIAGNRFSAADVYVGANLGWGMEFGTVEARPAFSAYVDRLRARPAYTRAMALDDALMEQGHP